uniref:Uncharacterized protein n=1 Tax=Bursaphelenchus xylophilus TaxID=6326 RepID=A0A1I7S7K3_BURXY
MTLSNPPIFRIRHLIFAFLLISQISPQKSPEGKPNFLSQPTRLDLLNTVPDSITTTTVMPKLLPNLLAEIGRDPREYFAEEAGKSDSYKTAVEKTKKPQKSDETSDSEDLKALLEGVNSGAEEWWKPVEQQQPEVAPAVKTSESERVLTSHSIDQDPLAHFRETDDDDDEEEPQFRIRLSPRKISGDTTSETLTMGGGSYSEKALVNFDSSSEEELLQKGLLKYDPKISKIFWSEMLKSEGPRMQKGPSFANIPGRFESLKHRSHEEGAKDSPDTTSDQALEHLRPFRTRISAVPVFVPTKDTTNQRPRNDQKSVEKQNPEVDMISKEIAALKATIDQKKEDEEKSAAREERDRESERFFSDDDSDEELRERVDSTGRPLNRGLNIRPLESVDQETNEGNSRPVAVRPIEVERPSLIGENLRTNQQSVQAGQEALIETIRTTVPPRFEANSGGSAAENSNLSQNQANLGGTQQNQQPPASNQAVAPSALPTVQTSLTGVAGSQISQNLPSGQVAQPVVFAAPASQQFQFPAAAGQPFGLGASAAQPEDVPQLS